MEKLVQSQNGPLEQLYSPAEYGKMKADSINQSKGNLTGYDCPKCLNRGQIAIPDPDGGTPTIIDCECMKIRNCIQKMERSGMCEVLDKYTFDAYTDSESWQKTVKLGAMRYADNPTGWLLFCGQSGSGKTHLCTAVCRKLLLSGSEVRYMPWRADVAELKGMAIEGERRSKYMKTLQQAPILFIDDLFKAGRSSDGACNPTAADIGIAFDLVNYRYTKQLPTIISTERSPLELVEIDEATGGRIIEMSAHATYEIAPKPGRNYRLRNVVTV